MPPKAYPMPDGSKPVFNTIEEARAFKTKNFTSTAPQPSAPATSKMESDRSFSIELPPEIESLRTWAMQAPTSEEMKKRTQIYESFRDDYFKRGAISPEIEKLKEGISGALLPQLGRLQQIETTDDPQSILNSAWQKAGNALNVNPELSGYLQASKGLKIPVLRSLLGEKGATQSQEQAAAQEISLPAGKEIFSQKNRPEMMENIFNTVFATSGIDFRKHLENTNPELLGSMGAFPAGSKGALDRRGVMTSDQLEEIVKNEVTGPKVNVTDYLRGLVGGKKKGPSAIELELMKRGGQ